MDTLKDIISKICPDNELFNIINCLVKQIFVAICYTQNKIHIRAVVKSV